MAQEPGLNDYREWNKLSEVCDPPLDDMRYALLWNRYIHVPTLLVRSPPYRESSHMYVRYLHMAVRREILPSLQYMPL
jgi:hypothetical protein